MYVFDCDELANLHIREDVESIWQTFVTLVDSGMIKTISQVFCELEKFDPALKRYKPLKTMMCLSAADQYSDSVTQIMDNIEAVTPNLIDFMGLKGPCDPSDPWLVAVGAAYGWTVVTHEKQSGRRIARSIFTACEALGVTCWNLDQFLTKSGRFKIQ